MALIYRFKKEKVQGERFVYRPRIVVRLHGSTSLEIPALIDSGCDITVIPVSIAQSIGIELTGEKDIITGFSESSEIIHGNARLTFIGRAERESVSVSVPVAIALDNADNEIFLGVEGVFDEFDVTFRKAHNKIILKKNL